MVSCIRIGIGELKVEISDIPHNRQLREGTPETSTFGVNAKGGRSHHRAWFPQIPRVERHHPDRRNGRRRYPKSSKQLLELLHGISVRISEAVGLDVDDLDFEQNLTHVLNT